MPSEENFVHVKVKKKYSRDRWAAGGMATKIEIALLNLQKSNKIVNVANKPVPLKPRH